MKEKGKGNRQIDNGQGWGPGGLYDLTGTGCILVRSAPRDDRFLGGCQYLYYTPINSFRNVIQDLSITHHSFLMNDLRLSVCDVIIVTCTWQTLSFGKAKRILFFVEERRNTI